MATNLNNITGHAGVPFGTMNDQQLAQRNWTPFSIRVEERPLRFRPHLDLERTARRRRMNAQAQR